ncbi:hypothetical protein MN116_007788 [Schistosoma mekongi]|uniref:Uncharacterized protein n=1 Tax=Schistosoma mekongi TaxID=38744 RepID=A0AAE2D2C1_SCHME|nr:hypothetical protein MN116_007788 [Schistosoma mekongi]
MLATTRPFIWIRFGENKKVLVNMWCSSEILLNHIISVCDIDPEITFDLCDTSGRLLGLSETQTSQQGIQSFESGAVYILVIIEGDKPDQQVNVRPMLTNFEQYYPNLTDQILQNLHDKSERYTKKKHLKRTPLQAKVTTSRKVKK